MLNYSCSSCSIERNLEALNFPCCWAEEESRAEQIGASRHVTFCQTEDRCPLLLSWSGKAAGPPIGGRGLGALAGRDLFTPAAAPGVFAASITLPPGSGEKILHVSK